jgi:purine-nucleoside phosphorylase
MKNEWQQVDRLAAAFGERFETVPKVVIVLGSGLGQAVKSLDNGKTAAASDLEGYPESTVSGHGGRVHCGTLSDVPAMILQGRVHLYEGYSPEEVVRPLRAAVTLGADTVVITNAAGGVNPGFAPGQLMLISDHLNLTGTSPLRGPNDDTRGPRFPDMTDTYDSKLRDLVKRQAAALNLSLAEGVYAGLVGPTYETPAEVRMLAALGADAVGMSTVQEAIACRHLGARIIGISCISNPAAGISRAPLNHEEVERTGAKASALLAELVISLTGALS